MAGIAPISILRLRHSLLAYQRRCSNIILKRLILCDGAQDTANLKQESILTEPENVTPEPAPEQEKAPETDNEHSPPEENQEDDNPEENPVMNFFKTLVSDRN